MANLRVIDVSEHQGTINWDVAKGHIDGAILRCGYGDNIASQDDKQWKRNADECTRLGIPFGVYIYSYATSDAQARSEAEHVLRLVSGYKLSYPIYLDLEQAGTENGAIQRANIFGDIIENAGYWCGVYANTNWWTNYLVGLERFVKWVAQYNSVCTYQGTYDIWQYTSGGSVPGISGNVDMNHCYRDYPAEITGGETKPTPPATGVSGGPGIVFTYGVMLTDGTILPFVNNLSDCAGLQGRTIAGIAMKVNKGSVKYRVHVKGADWLPYVTGCDWNDANNGYAGYPRAVIDAVEVYYDTPADIVAKYGYQKAQYRVAPIGGGYYPWQFDNEVGNGQDGHAGVFGVAFDRFQLF